MLLLGPSRRGRPLEVPVGQSRSVLFEGANAYKAPVVCTNRLKSNS